jgi:poly-beta-1,6-N-acetyl-D-glucosamine synthase
MREEIMGLLVDKLAQYVFWYPLIMSLFWIAGSNIYNRRRETKTDIDFEKNRMANGKYIDSLL